MQFIQYILIASACLSLFYLGYLLVYRKETNFRQLRFFLLGSMLLSLLVPLNQFTINTGFTLRNQQSGNTAMVHYREPGQPSTQTQEARPTDTPMIAALVNSITEWNWPVVLMKIYWLITLLLLARIGAQLIMLTLQYIKSDKIFQKDCVLLYNHRFNHTFSFFRWIFINDQVTGPENVKQIIAHEKIHVSQFHSLDILAIELLTAVMWFNPLIWKMKQSLQLVHEYLADEGALCTGIDRLSYQALLINQVAEERLICLSSSFNHALIKKRIIMMTTSKINPRTKFRLLTLIPISATLFMLVAIFNGLMAENVQAGNQDVLLQVSENSDPANTVNQALPPDTIRKKTISKTISKDNPQDTVIQETEEIIVVDDVTKSEKMIWHMKDEDAGEGNKVMIFIDEDGEKSHTILMGDSAKVVTVIKTSHGGEDKIIKEEKHIEIRHADEKTSSKILYVVDGVQQVGEYFLSTLDPNQVESMDVIKGRDMKKYTDKDYEGVILITTKAAKKK